MGRKGKKTLGQAPIVAGHAGGRSEIECCDTCLRRVDGAWLGVLASMQRRRNSYRLMTYFGCSGCLSLLVFALACGVYVFTWNSFHAVSGDCMSDPAITSNSMLMNNTLTAERVFVCKDAAGLEEMVGAACDLQDMRFLLDTALSSGIILGLQGLNALILAFAFKMFTNLPTELLQHGKVSLLSRLLGGICKGLPWFNRLFHIGQFITLMVLNYFIVETYCKGDWHIVWNCRNFRPDCSYNKAKNCRYHFKICQPDEEQYSNCWLADSRAAFSGRMDVRLLTHDQCARCQILAADIAKTADEDEFFLLEETDRGTDNWKCLANADLCFSTTAWSAIACNCAETVNDILDPAAVTALTANCPKAAARMLGEVHSNEEPYPRPCWLGNASACPSIIEGEANVAAEHQKARDAEILRKEEAWIRHMQERQDTNEREEERQMQRLVELDTTPALRRSMHRLVDVAEDADSDRRLQNATAGNATAAVGAPAPGAGEPLPNQQCTWGPNNPDDYWFATQDCGQHGSFLYRVALLYDYLAGVIWVLTTFFSQIVRVTSRPEPWFFNPQAPNEGCFWRAFRKLGP